VNQLEQKNQENHRLSRKVTHWSHKFKAAQQEQMEMVHQ
jgi:hypothetical protein